MPKSSKTESGAICLNYRQLRRRLQNLGFKYQDAAATSRWFQKNLRSRGALGAITYFKEVGAALHASLTGVSYDQSRSPVWVSLKGPDRVPSVFFRIFGKYNKALWLRITKFARAIKLKEIHETQVDKVYTAIVSPCAASSEALQTMCCVLMQRIKATDSGSRIGIIM
jgi:hypothetical protein